MPRVEQRRRRAIRFLLDGRRVELEHIDPNRTVLQYLREDLGRTGTKEGCAEGDCGACTVALVERSGDSPGGLRVRAVNSCIQFLPALDGRELLTVESLRAADGSLHPVQAAMVECHGSQCGFCTPGFVMSLFAHFKNSADTSRRAVDEALAGNLCRCTGYQPIVEAASRMYALADADADWLRRPYTELEGSGEDPLRAAALDELERGGGLSMTVGRRRFDAPESCAELAEMLLANPGATLVAGGTDVGLWVTKELRGIDHIIYTARVADLRDVGIADGVFDIGAAVTLSELAPLVEEYFPDLRDLVLRFASPPIRNAATLGGNVANGSPIGDSLPALLALDASLVLRRGDRRRTLPLCDFYIGYRKNALAESEFVERIRVPRMPSGAILRSYKVSKRFDQDISAVCGAFYAQIVEGRLVAARIAYGGMAAKPRRAAAAEQALLDTGWSEDGVQRAMRALPTDFVPITDMRASAEYRMLVAQNLLQRFWIDVNEPGAELEVYRHGE